MFLIARKSAILEHARVHRSIFYSWKRFRDEHIYRQRICVNDFRHMEMCMYLYLYQHRTPGVGLEGHCTICVFAYTSIYADGGSLLPISNCFSGVVDDIITSTACRWVAIIRISYSMSHNRLRKPHHLLAIQLGLLVSRVQ